MNNDLLLSIRDLYFAYKTWSFKKTQHIFKNFHLSVHAAQCIALCGSNGSGKSTLLKLIVGALLPSKGTIKSYGHLGYVPQQLFPHDWLTGIGWLAYHAQLLGLSKKNQMYEIKRVVELLHIESYCAEKINTYSAGMLQKLFIGQALIGNPPLLILDEPFSSLDIESYTYTNEIVKHYLQNKGAIVYATHTKFFEQTTDCITLGTT